MAKLCADGLMLSALKHTETTLSYAVGRTKLGGREEGPYKCLLQAFNVT
jgi:hypothetical protein